MRFKNRFIPGSHNVICDRTGFKMKAHEVSREWNGRIVRTKSFDPKHELLTPPKIRRVRPVDDARPRQAPILL